MIIHVLWLNTRMYIKLFLMVSECDFFLWSWMYMNLLLMGSECDFFLWSSWISSNEYDTFGWRDQLIHILTCKFCMCTHYYTCVMFVSIKVKVSAEVLTVYETVLLPRLPCCTDANSTRPHHKGAPYRKIVWLCEKDPFAPDTCFLSANIWLFCTARLLLWSKENTISTEPYAHTNTHATSQYTHMHVCTHAHTHTHRVLKSKKPLKLSATVYNSLTF